MPTDPTRRSPADAPPDDHALAAELARLAGRALVELRARMVADGADLAEMKDVGDRESHLLLMERLASARPDDAVLSEEGKDDPARLEAERVWIVDPLDGTREFGEPPREDWAVHVALAIGGVPVVGAVGLPARGLVLSTADPPPTDHPVDPSPRVVVSRTRMPAPVLELTERIGGRTIPLGSAGAKTMAVVLGEADVYAHVGGQYEWDSAAPVAVALAAGLHASRVDGAPLRYNQPDVSLPDLLVCHPSLAARCLAVLAEGRGDG